MRVKLTEQYDIALTKREMMLLASAMAQYALEYDVPDELRDAIEQFVEGYDGEKPPVGKEKETDEPEAVA